MQYLGKYRAFVTDNNDPLKQGRVKVQVPYISGDSSLGWALPCVPVASKNFGDLAVPKVNSFVWVEFEHGDINYPIYTGGIYGDDGILVSDLTTRVISWGKGKIFMREDRLVLEYNNTQIILDDSGIHLNQPLTSNSSISTSSTVSASNIH